jgi:hypothetical protein
VFDVFAGRPGDDWLRIYPNPADDRLFIDLDDRSEGSLLDIEILDLTGRPVHTVKATGDRSLGLGSLPRGIYLVRVGTGRQTATRKLVVK